MISGNGYVLPVDKPCGPSSHDVVDRARRVWGERRVGHCGTLDPFASGLLVLCVGKVTRLAEYLGSVDKSYLATARLGVETESHDTEGTVTASSEDWHRLAPSRVEAALAELTGELMQVPPRFSAKKIGGERAYRRARRGERVELAPVRVRVTRLEMASWDPPELTLRIDCSTGTYVRALARDLGRILAVGAHLTALRRIRSGAVDLSGAVGFDFLDDAEAVHRARMNPLAALAHLPRVEAGAAEERELGFGRGVEVEALDDAEPGVVCVSRSGELVAVAEGERTESGRWRLRPRKVFPG